MSIIKKFNLIFFQQFNNIVKIFYFFHFNFKTIHFCERLYDSIEVLSSPKKVKYEKRKRKSSQKLKLDDEENLAFYASSVDRNFIFLLLNSMLNIKVQFI